MVKITIANSIFQHVHTAVTYPTNSDTVIDFTGNQLLHVKTAFEERDAKGLVAALGLPNDTPTEEIISVIRELRQTPVATPEAGEAFLKESKLWSYISRSSDTVSVISGLLTLAASTFGIPASL